MKRVKKLLAFLLLSGMISSVMADDNSTVNGQIVIHADQPRGTINRNIYGQFSEHLGRCIYEGIWVGEDSPIPNTRGIRNDVVAALKQLNVPVLRWPGGCFADEYHWKGGIGPRDKRPKMINTHWGDVVENNAFGAHEFFDLCEQPGCEPYICGNVGSGSDLQGYYMYPENVLIYMYMPQDVPAPRPLAEEQGCSGARDHSAS